MTYNDNIHSTTKLTPVDTSKNPEKMKYYPTSNKN